MTSMSRAAGTEDCGADPDMGGAEADRFLEIGAHAHAEDLQVVAPGDFAQQREMRSRFLVERRHAHQADDRKIEPLPAFADKPVRIGRHYAGLLRFLSGVYLDEAGGPATAMLHLLGEGLREPQPVDALDHVETR